jgi:putative membrane protein
MKRVFVTALLCIVSCAAHAEEADSSKPVSAAQSFVTKATQDGLAEVQMGKLAQSRSSDEKVKSFAAQMVADHSKANAELSALAKRKNLTVPTELDKEHATMVHTVSAKPPSEFDAEYGKHMIEAHDAAVTLFKDAAAVGDKEIAGFAKTTLPTLQKHQQLAASLPSKLPPRAGLDAGDAGDVADPPTPQAQHHE